MALVLFLVGILLRRRDVRLNEKVAKEDQHRDHVKDEHELGKVRHAARRALEPRYVDAHRELPYLEAQGCAYRKRFGCR